MQVEENTKLSFEAELTLFVRVPGKMPVQVEHTIPLNLHHVGLVGTALQRHVYNALIIALQEIEATSPSEIT